MSTNYLHSLKIKHLVSILRHVQLGHEHLNKNLSKEEFKDLLAIGNLSNKQIEHLESDAQEKLGNVSIVVNTILTSTFGAWLGFNAFKHTSIISPGGILIIICGLGFGFLTGYLSYLLTHRQARLAFRNQRIANVQRVVTEIIIHKREEKISHVCAKIQDNLQQLDPSLKHQHALASNQLLEKLINLKFPIEDGFEFQHLLNRVIAQLSVTANKILSGQKSFEENTTTQYDATDFLLNNALTNASYIKVLTKTDLPNKNQIPKVQSWLKKNFVGISVGLLPTFLGSFASMFVFLNGFPAFLNGLHIHLGLTSHQVHLLKHGTLLAAFSISIYFAYSHIHSNYKAFKRSKQLEIAEQQNADRLSKMVKLMNELAQWNKIFYQLQIITDIKKINPFQPKLSKTDTITDNVQAV